MKKKTELKMRSFVVLYGLFMATYRLGLVWSFLAVIEPNSFGLVQIEPTTKQ